MFNYYDYCKLNSEHSCMYAWFGFIDIRRLFCRNTYRICCTTVRPRAARPGWADWMDEWKDKFIYEHAWAVNNIMTCNYCIYLCLPGPSMLALNQASSLTFFLFQRLSGLRVPLSLSRVILISVSIFFFVSIFTACHLSSYKGFLLVFFNIIS